MTPDPVEFQTIPEEGELGVRSQSYHTAVLSHAEYVPPRHGVDSVDLNSTIVP